jgi:mannose-6-phosphate isomerase-like protein (cupin superfamily)
VELGRHTGLSAALLSKIERGKLYPPLPTLLRIALVFGVGLDHFISDERRQNPVAIVRKRERKRFPERPGARDPAYEFESLDFAAVERKMSAYYAEFRPIHAEDARPHQHPGAELLYVLHGRLGLRVRDDEHVLEAGDSVYFNSSVPHSYRALGRGTCDAVVVTAP